jgi:hypothetical protein
MDPRAEMEKFTSELYEDIQRLQP